MLLERLNTKTKICASLVLENLKKILCEAKMPTLPGRYGISMLCGMGVVADGL